MFTIKWGVYNKIRGVYKKLGVSTIKLGVFTIHNKMRAHCGVHNKMWLERSEP